jgi:Flp pilus assembly protein TadB
MPLVILALLVAMGGALIVLLAIALPPRTTRARRRTMPHFTLTPTRRVQLLVGAAIGLVAALFTGWVVLIVIVPLAVIGVPWLLSAQGDDLTIARLDALESWTRSLAGLTVAGAGLERTISASRASCPAAIKPEVTRLVARLSSRTPTDEALRMFADELDDETGDLVVAHLLLKAELRGPGLATALEDLAESILSEVRARRQIETERSGPRNEVRMVVYITIGVLVLLFVARDYSAPYSTPLGQLLLALYVALDILLLFALKRVARSKPGPRILLPSERGAR